MNILELAARQVESFKVHMWTDPAMSAQNIGGGHAELPQAVCRPKDPWSDLPVARA